MQEIDARSDSGCEEIQIVKKVLESMWVQRTIFWSLWWNKSSATGYNLYVTRDAVRQGAISSTFDILLRLGLLCVTLFNLDTLCLTYSDPERVPKDSHMLNGQNIGLTKEQKWSNVLLLRKPWWLSRSGRISNWLLEDSAMWRLKKRPEDFWHANFLAHYLL